MARHQRPHRRTSKKGNRFYAGLGSKNTRTNVLIEGLGADYGSYKIFQMGTPSKALKKYHEILDTPKYEYGWNVVTLSDYDLEQFLEKKRKQYNKPSRAEELEDYLAQREY